MNTKAQAIKSFLENIEADLNGKYETIHDQFVVDLLLEQHHKAKHAFDLLNVWNSYYLDNIYGDLFNQLNSVNDNPGLNDSSIECLFALLHKEIVQLDERKESYSLEKIVFINNSDMAELIAICLMGLLNNAFILSTFLIAPAIVMFLIVSTAVFTFPLAFVGCVLLFHYAMEQHLQHALTQINEHHDFTKTYDYDSDKNSLEIPGENSPLTIEVNNVTKKVTISTKGSSLSFFRDRASNGADVLFKPILTKDDLGCGLK